MRSSGAAIVKEYLEKYVLINLLKTKQNRYFDQKLARKALSIAFDVIHEMDYLILSNNANDFAIIKNCLRHKVSLMHEELRARQSLIESYLSKTTLPPDFSKCVYEAWFVLKEFERQASKKRQRIVKKAAASQKIAKGL